MFENESGDIVAIDNSAEVVENKQNTEISGEPVETTKEPAEKQEKDNTADEVKKKRPSGFHRKISKLEQLLAESNARLAEMSKPATLDIEPQLDNFETYDAWIRALNRYETAKVIKEERETAAKEQEKAARAKQLTEVESAWAKKEESLGDSQEEYEELVAQHSETPFRVELLQATSESDLGPQIRLFLLKNPDELAKVNKSPAELSSYAIFKKVAELEARLSAKPAVKVSKSSEPINPVKGTVKTAAVKLDNLDTDSYIAQRYPHLSAGR